MKEIIWVGLGGFFGSAFRYMLGGVVLRLVAQPFIPLGTFAVNMLGCFLIGLLTGFGETRDLFTPQMRLFVFVGVLGGFTTFSTFGLDTFTLANAGEVLRAILNVVLQVVVGVGAVWVGYSLSKGG